MCESSAYIDRGDKEELLMENVIMLKPEGGKVYLRSLLGEDANFDGAIKEIKLLDHKIILTPRK